MAPGTPSGAVKPKARKTGTLFLPLDTPPYLKFEANIKTAEVRPDVLRWADHVVYTGRGVLAARGYNPSGPRTDAFTSTVGRVHRGPMRDWPEWAHKAAALHVPVPDTNDPRYIDWLKRNRNKQVSYFDENASLVVFEHLNIKLKPKRVAEATP